jgi:hypothetical protein
MTRFRIIAVVACCMLLSSAAMAQERPLPGPAGDRPPASAQREDTRRKVEALRMARLTETLKLDEKTASKFIPAITVNGQKRREQMALHHQAIGELRQQLGGPAVDEKKLKPSVDRAFASQREMVKLREKELEAIRDNLTLEQQARYMVFQQEFMQEVRDVMRGSSPGGKAQRGRMAPRRGGETHPAGPPQEVPAGTK